MSFIHRECHKIIFSAAKALAELLARLTAVFDANPTVQWEALLVDDGSRDRSTELIRAHAGRDPRFVLLELSRNFGFQAAIAAGLAHARGQAVVTMDADLQDPPECIPEMVARGRRGRAGRAPFPAGVGPAAARHGFVSCHLQPGVGFSHRG